jgi:hypothetical protein
MTVNMTTMTTTNRVLLRPINEVIARQARSTISLLRPAAVRRVTRVVSAKPVAKRAWVSPLSETFGERVLYGLLVAAALGGIAYGMLDVIEHVQNWPVFNAWVGRILGA